MFRRIKKIIFRDYFSDKVKIRKRRGLSLLLRYRNYIDRKLVVFEKYENEQTAFIVKLVNDNRAEIFLDVGANFGLYSLLIAQRCPSVSTVIAFEPDENNYNHLCGNIFVNGFSEKIKTHRLGVSDRSGVVRFLKNLGNSSGTSRIVETAPVSTKNQRFHEVEINVAALDSVLADYHGQIIAMKIDVEGHELKVLSGAERLMANNKCFMQIEILEDTESVVANICADYKLKCIANIGSDYYFSNLDKLF